MTNLTLEEATTTATATAAKARELGMNPISVAVLNMAGTTKCLQTEDGASLMRPDIAYAKA
ncbi:MAG: heme-binding protein [Pseudomonadota bacterium]